MVATTNGYLPDRYGDLQCGVKKAAWKQSKIPVLQ
jgi:hypothetical protein